MFKSVCSVVCHFDKHMTVNVTGDDCSDMPADSGSLLYQFLLHPDNTLIENLTPEILQVTQRYFCTI